MQVEYKTEKGIIRFRMIPNDGNVFNTGITSKNTTDEGFDFIGLSTKITEEQAKMMVDYKHENDLDESEPSCTSSLIDIYYPFDYIHNSYYELESFLDSFKSLMQHLKVYEVNPYIKPNANDYKIDSFTDSLYLEDMETEYLEAQSRTGKWIVLFKSNV